MIVDERTYTIAPGQFGPYLARHLETALPIMRRHLGDPLAYYASDTGAADQFVHLWRYADAADRAARRARLYADPAWLAYRAAAGETGRVLLQENRLLRALEIPKGPPC